jgi:hypothetical protein
MQVSRFTSACENILRVPALASCVARTGVSAPHFRFYCRLFWVNLYTVFRFLEDR